MSASNPDGPTVSFCSLNIQYSLGRDGEYDLPRVADAVREADVIALQEVWTNDPFAPDAQQAERLAELLPNHHWVYWPAFDLDAGEVADDGTVVNRRLQFGQMVLSRYPIEYSRSLDLPMVEPGHLRKQRTVIEALITTPRSAPSVRVR